MKRKRPTVSIDSEIGRRVGREVEPGGKRKEWQSIGMLAGIVMRDVNRKR